MKKFISSVTAAAFLAVMTLSFGSSLTVSAAEYSINNMTLTYTVSGSSAMITDCSGSASSFVIPAKIGTYTVTSIEKEAFSECSSLVSITIPDSVTAIQGSAFWNCSSLKSVYIGSGVASVGDYAFSSCPELSTFTVSSSNQNFSDVNGMLFSKDGSTLICYAGGSSAVVPDSASSIGKAAFFGNSKITSVTIPSGVSSIGNYAFSGCFRLAGITVPMSVKSLGKGAFMNCTSLTGVVLGSGLTEIPQECFSMCTSLETVNIGSGIQKIGDQAFFSCSKLSGIYIPQTVTSIGTDAAGTHYSIRSGKNIPLRGFYISGETGSAAEKYAIASGVDFIDFANIPYGDVNKDRAVDAVDSSLVLAEYASTATGRLSSFTFYQFITADCNSDGNVDAIDASWILAEYVRNATGG